MIYINIVPVLADIYDRSIYINTHGPGMHIYMYDRIRIYTHVYIHAGTKVPAGS